ncbi:hypothetical protein TSAR_003169 [Trichomalopsis sarcophagae]|uniref:Uncharacterized protein n=1 Tax=Trichomalopsis sarcophagae TaxID=543379 RepID=A0A232EGG1_9HYME|nr:hypothetical protein TSAR_003169 [Trichomalopsis sarcophagae]
MATDNHACSILPNKLRKFIDLTDYTIQPVIPRYVGMAENTSNKAITMRASGMSSTSLNAVNTRITNRLRKKD